MDGIINILKPPGMTSHDVVAFVRRNLKVKKVGHTGTLDPGVSGVLPICLGKATKIAQFLTDDDKVYRGELTLGKITSTQDGFGEVLVEKDPSNITTEDINLVIKGFLGKIEQIPPMVSAVKHQGKRLYELAREGIEVERKARIVTIKDIKIIYIKDLQTKSPRILMDIKCTKGTYIRTLFNDIGEKLGVGGYMSFLIRTQTGQYSIDSAVTLEELILAQEAHEIEKIVQPIGSGLPNLPTVIVKSQAIESIKHGNPVFLPGVQSPVEDIEIGKLVKLFSPNEEILAIAEARPNETKTQPEIYFQPQKVF
jgi:tRNA pseudouridine55 synthase